MKVAELLHALRGRVAQANVYRFCQLLEQAAPGHPPLGSTGHPGDDLVRFRPDPGMGFPASELRAVEFDEAQPQRPPTVRTRLLGLYGVDSPLPTAYLDDITLQRDGHEALEAFLDIFNHRIFTQFYRVWRKYSYPACFEAGGTDATSQCLLGLIGLGIPGTAERIATPVSRFLALLGVMRLPTRNAEGVQALVRLLSPRTQATITAHDPHKVEIARPAGFYVSGFARLGDNPALGPYAFDVNSQLLVQLHSENTEEIHQWLPGAQLHSDLLVLLRVYLGWRCTARLQLVVPRRCLPAPELGFGPVRLGLTAVFQSSPQGSDSPIAINLGRYTGLQGQGLPRETEITHVAYRS